MRNLMKFGMVLVVLAMVTSVGFARTQEYEGPDLGTWCDDDNWDSETPRGGGKKDDVEIDNGNTVVIDCEPAEIDELMIINGGVQVGVAAVEDDPDTPEDETVVGVNVYLRCDGDLEMARGSTSDYAILDIVNGYVYVEDGSSHVFKDGSGEISIAAGSGLLLDNGARFGDSNGDGCGDTYTLDIAGGFTIAGNRFEHRGGHLIINLTGDGTADIGASSEDTARFSAKRDAIATININMDEDGEAVFSTRKIELGQSNDGADCDYSMEVNVGGNGTWDGDNGSEVKDNKDGQILNINVTGNGSVELKDLNINNDDSVLNITMDSGSIDISDDIEMNAGDIVITGGVFNVEDDFKLGDDGVATITVSGTADVWIDDLYMNDDSVLTIDGVRMDIDDLKNADGSIVITPNGSLVIKNADDQDDWDDLNKLVDDGDIVASEGASIVTDYGVTHDGKFTIQAVYPFEVDIKPGSCQNPLRVNLRGRGVLPVAIVGSDTFDVTTVDLDSVTLLGVPALRAKVVDVSTAGVCDAGPDSIPDILLKFNRADVLDALEERYGTLSDIPNREVLSILVLGELQDDGGTVGGTDTLTILNRGAVKRRR